VHIFAYLIDFARKCLFKNCYAYFAYLAYFDNIFCKKKYLEKNNFQCNSAFIKSNFGFLPKSITFLEKKGIKLSNSLKTVEDAENKIVDLSRTEVK